MPIFKIQHTTQYIYDRPVSESANQVKIFPVVNAQQELHHQKLVITNEPALQYFTDYWGNSAALFMVSEPHTQLIIDSQVVVHVKPHSGVHPVAAAAFSDWQTIQQHAAADLKLLDYAKPESPLAKDEILRLVQDLRGSDDTPALFAQRCSEHIFSQFAYQKGITTVETTVDEILEHKSGVCQDFAHVLLEMLRTVAIPSRYVSGYICPNHDGARGAGATHAWVEVYLPALGWVGIDPTNNTWVTDKHVVLAVGRHFNDCSPAKGMFKGPANQALSVFVSVGYEDGFVFEENNAVELPPMLLGAPAIDAAQAMQQQ